MFFAGTQHFKRLFDIMMSPCPAVSSDLDFRGGLGVMSQGSEVTSTTADYYYFLIWPDFFVVVVVIAAGFYCFRQSAEKKYWQDLRIALL